jgi:acetyl-CoA carboxylase biotin carboxyl carrier protein
MSNRNDRQERDRVERQPIVQLEYLQGLISAVDGSGIDSLEISRGGTRIRISKTPPPATSAAPAAAPMAAPEVREQPYAPEPAPQPAEPPAPAPLSSSDAGLAEVKSPMVGTFYRSPSPDAPAYVELGSRVVKGQALCILEAMKLMNELQAEVAGVVRDVCVENGEPVEYGQVLFRIEPDA